MGPDLSCVYGGKKKKEKCGDNRRDEQTNNTIYLVYIIKIKIHSSCEIEDFVELIFSSCA